MNNILLKDKAHCYERMTTELLISEVREKIIIILLFFSYYCLFRVFCNCLFYFSYIVI
jgi:hypothetical protein